MAAEISSQSNASTVDEWRTRLQEIEEIVRRLGSKEKSSTDSVHSSSQMADSRKESKGRTLLLKIHLLRYSISWEELDLLFARFGMIECIEIFCPEDQYHSKIRFQQRESAMRAIESFNHRNIYDGCCRMELILEAEIDDGFQEPKNRTQPLLHISEHRSTAASASESWERRIRMQDNLRRMEELVKKLHEEPCRSKVQASTEEEGSVEIEIDSNVKIETPIQTTLEDFKAEKQEMQAPSLATAGGFQDCQQEGSEAPVGNANQIDAPGAEVNQEITHLIREGDEILEDILVQSVSSMFQESKRCSIPTDEDNPKEPHVQSNKFEVNPNSSCDVVSEAKELVELVVLLIELIEIRLANGRVSSLIDIWLYEVELLEIYGAHQVFVKMPKREFWLLTDLKYTRSNDASLGDGLMQDTITISSDKGQRTVIDSNMRLDWNGVFDPGGCIGRDGLSGKMFNCGIALSSGGVVLVETDGEMDGYMVYDKGKLLPFDRGIPSIDVIDNVEDFLGRKLVVEFRQNSSKSFPYDRGKSGNAIAACFLRFERESYVEVATIKGFIFDPGGIDPLLREQVAHQLVVSIC